MLLKSFKHNVGDINVTDHLVYHLWHLNQGERDTQCLIWTIILLINHFVSRSNTLYIYIHYLDFLLYTYIHSDYLLYTYCLLEEIRPKSFEEEKLENGCTLHSLHHHQVRRSASLWDGLSFWALVDSGKGLKAQLTFI